MGECIIKRHITCSELMTKMNKEKYRDKLKNIHIKRLHYDCNLEIPYTTQFVVIDSIKFDNNKDYMKTPINNGFGLNIHETEFRLKKDYFEHVKTNTKIPFGCKFYLWCYNIEDGNCVYTN